jgi:predicted ATP-dependent endonuclease of OLD family
MKLDGFGIAGYRSFGPQMCRIENLSKINIFIGKNNSGKSNILKFIKNLPKIRKRMLANEQYREFKKDLDFNKNFPNQEIGYALQIKKDSPITGDIYSKITSVLPKLIENSSEYSDSIWPEYYTDTQNENFRFYPSKEKLQDEIHRIYNQMETEKKLKNLVDTIHRYDKIYNTPFFKVKTIEVFRQITAEEIKDESNLSGRGLINELKNLQNPILSVYDKSKSKFERLNNFLRDLLGEKDAYLEIPAGEDVINVKLNGPLLPLDSFGTGIHELIILAAAVTIEEDVVFCIEEPEIHLHPELQKKFVQYIKENTNNQYLISTHSNAFFDMDGVNIYHCQLVDGQTTCKLVKADKEKLEILKDLGYKASDILQANCVIWVEGPSDRIYINHWIEGKDQELKEGIHYSIMFYGGRLLSHLTLDNPESEKFIQLCRLNQKSAIVMDSDKDSSQDNLNATKNRILEEFEKEEEFKEKERFAWVTQGREIENYIPLDVYKEAAQKIHPKIEIEFKEGGYT